MITKSDHIVLINDKNRNQQTNGNFLNFSSSTDFLPQNMKQRTDVEITEEALELVINIWDGLNSVAMNFPCWAYHTCANGITNINYHQQALNRLNTANKLYQYYSIFHDNFLIENKVMSSFCCRDEILDLCLFRIRRLDKLRMSCCFNYNKKNFSNIGNALYLPLPETTLTSLLIKACCKKNKTSLKDSMSNFSSDSAISPSSSSASFLPSPSSSELFLENLLSFTIKNYSIDYIDDTVEKESFCQKKYLPDANQSVALTNSSKVEENTVESKKAKSFINNTTQYQNTTHSLYSELCAATPPIYESVDRSNFPYFHKQTNSLLVKPQNDSSPSSSSTSSISASFIQQFLSDLRLALSETSNQKINCVQSVVPMNIKTHLKSTPHNHRSQSRKHGSELCNTVEYRPLIISHQNDENSHDNSTPLHRNDFGTQNRYTSLSNSPSLTPDPNSKGKNTSQNPSPEICENVSVDGWERFLFICFEKVTSGLNCLMNNKPVKDEERGQSEYSIGSASFLSSSQLLSATFNQMAALDHSKACSPDNSQISQLSGRPPEREELTKLDFDNPILYDTVSRKRSRLSSCSTSQNSRGSPSRTSLLSPCQGVCWDPTHKRWVAHWSDSQTHQRIRKYFNPKILGFNEARLLAVLTRKEAVESGKASSISGIHEKTQNKQRGKRKRNSSDSALSNGNIRGIHWCCFSERWYCYWRDSGTNELKTECFSVNSYLDEAAGDIEVANALAFSKAIEYKNTVKSLVIYNP